MSTTRTRRTRRDVNAHAYLEKVSGGALSFGGLLSTLRLCEDMSQADFARRLGISRSHLCDIEKGRASVRAARAASFAKILGYSPASFVAMALQDQVNQAGLELSVEVGVQKAV